MSTQPTDYSPVTAYLTVKDGAKAIEFYQEAFGAVELYRLTDSATGNIGHAELLLNGGMIMLSSEHPAWNKSPDTLGGTPVKICLMVKDTDASFAQASAAGATTLMAPADQFYGFRCASVRDPFGHEWMIQHEIEKVTPEEMQVRWDAMIKECK
jgi:PhnB protein